MQRIQKAVLKAKSALDVNKPATLPKTANSPAEVSLENLQYTRTRVISSHPDRLENHRIVAGLLDNQNSQTFRTLRTQVIQKMRDNNFCSLAITSPSNSEGKSLIAANLAVAIAMEVNHTVLLVDLDLKNPTVHKLFGIEQSRGFLDYIRGDTELDEIMVNPGIERLVVIPGFEAVENSSEIISSPKMVSFFNETKSRYSSRIVIFDMPPILPTDDVLSSIGHIDSALLVLEDGRNTEKDIVRSMRQIQKTTLLGTVINKFHRGSWIL